MLLPKIIGRFKMISAKEINKFHNITSNPVWQRNYYEHIIHDEKEWNNIRDYIINNPLQWFFDDKRPSL
jgi:putative transposase